MIFRSRLLSVSIAGVAHSIKILAHERFSNRPYLRRGEENRHVGSILIPAFPAGNEGGKNCRCFYDC